MPDDKGKLTPEDQAKINQWWNGRWTAAVPCTVCKTTVWQIGAYVVNLPRFATDAYAGGTETFPHIIVFCSNCSHTMLFSATTIGLYEPYRLGDDSLPLLPPGGSASG